MLRLLAGLFLVVAIVNAVVATCDRVVWPLAVTSLSVAVALVLERHTTTLVGVASSR